MSDSELPKNNTQRITVSRRQLIKGAVAGTLAWSVGTHVANAEEALSEDDPMAVALAYKEDAAEIDASEHANYSPDQNCANCLQYKTKEGAAVGGCALFPGKTVTAKGWCKVWAKG